MKNRQKIKNRDEISEKFSTRVLSFLERRNSPIHWKDIANAMNLKSSKDTNNLIKTLKKLASKGKLTEEKGKFSAKNKAQIFTGVLDVNSSSNGFLICPDTETDIFIPEKYLNHAFDGDTVQVALFSDTANSDKPKGEVVNIVSRKKTAFIGTLQIIKEHAFVICSEKSMYVDFYISHKDLNGAKDGQKVLISFKKWDKKEKSPSAVIEKILGTPGEHYTEMSSILLEYDLPEIFPEEVERYAKNLNTIISEDEIKRRRDMRNVLTFTIDPADAKDFDDAISFQILENGNYQVGVHIADVSYYVTPSSILDEEAYKRATSIYLVDRVIPMLPEILSNFACSLRPNEDKYTFSAVFEIDKNAKVVSQWFGRTVINSNSRFAYEEAQEIIENFQDTTTYTPFTISQDVSIREGAYSVSKDLVEAIATLNSLAKKMKQARMVAGAISFEKLEVKFHLDQNNNPIGIYTKESKEANNLIEEFMLLANKKVAEFVAKQNKTFVYRVHEAPDQEKLTQMNTVISHFGYVINMESDKKISSSLNSILTQVKGKKEQNLVDTLAMRSMSKAKYSTKNIGHYGLAFDYYSHFTSPIRRYPDVMAHRLLQLYLDNKPSADEKFYQECCNHSSSMENLAASAERDSIKYMQVKYMQNHNNKVFDGVISGISEWGIYVEIIENKCEGMIRTRDLKDDFYNFDEKMYALVGQRTGRVYQLGDEVAIRVKNTDLIRRLLDFELVSKK